MDHEVCQNLGGIYMSKSQNFFVEKLIYYLKFVYRKLKYISLLARAFTSNARRVSFWQRMVIRYLWRRPFWFTDKYGVTLRLYPDDSLEALFANKMHFDDNGVLEVTKKL